MTTTLVADRRLHPATLYIAFVRKIPQFVIGLPAAIGWASEAGIGRFLLFAGCGAAISAAISLLGWLRFRYGVGDSDIVIESGIIQHQRRIIPFDRIHDIDIEQKLLARLSGTARVRIETGGAARDEGSLDAVALGEAHRLRDWIRGSRAAVSDGVEPAAQATEPLLFAMGMRRLLAAGLLNFSLLYLAAIGAAFQYLEPLLDLDAFDPRLLVAPAEAAASRITLIGSLLLLAVLLLLGIVTGIIRTITRDYGFRLTRTGSGLRRVRGLVTRSEIVIPLRRIQLALIRSGPIARWFGWAALEYQTLGADPRQGGHQTAVPLGRADELLPVLTETGHDGVPPREEMIRVSRRSVARRCIRMLVPFAAPLLALGLFETRVLLFLLLFPIPVAAAILLWRRHRYALTDRMLVVSHGFLQRRLWIVHFRRAQTISVSRSFLQRRLGLASLTVDTAGASAIHYPVIRDLEGEVADALAARLLELSR